MLKYGIHLICNGSHHARKTEERYSRNV